MGRISNLFRTAPRWAQLSLVAFAVATATPMAIIPGVDATEAMVKNSGLDALLERSPGVRTDALLEKVKASRVSAASADDEPSQRALGKIFDTPVEAAVAAVPAMVFPNEVVPAPFSPISDIAALPSAAPASGGGVPRIFSPIALVGGGGGGGGGVGGGGGSGGGGGTGGGTGGGGGGADDPGGGGGGDNGPPVIVTNPGAVPEPGTWVLLLLGMAMTGGALRFDRRKAAKGRKLATRAA